MTDIPELVRIKDVKPGLITPDKIHLYLPYFFLIAAIIVPLNVLLIYLVRSWLF